MNLIFAKLDALRTSLRRLALARGLSLTLAVLLASTLIVGWLDFEFRWNAAVARWLAWGMVLLPTCLAASLTILWPWMTSISRLQVALRVERLDPNWQGELAAFVGLAEGPSSAVAPGVVQQVQYDLIRRLPDAGDLDALALLDQRRVRFAWGTVIGLLAASLACLATRPLETVIALTRVFRPWTAQEWPRETRLEVYDGQFHRLSPVEPLHVVANQPLTIFIRDAEAGPPPQVRLMVHQGNQTRFQSLVPVRRIEQGRELDLFQATLFPDRRQLFFRASAGDDDTMRWFSVIGSSPPQLVSSAVKLIPPAFTGRGPESLDLIPPRLSGFPGTTVSIRGTVDQPVKEALFRVDGEPPRRLVLGPSKKQFTAELTPLAPGRSEFWFTFIDAGGLRDPDPPRYEFLAVEDRLPEIRFNFPAGDLRVTPNASVPVSVTGTDDCGIGSLAVTVSSEDETLVREVARREATAADQTQLVLETTVPIADWSLVPGNRLKLGAWVSDRHPADNRVQRSPACIMTVVTEAEKRRELAGKLASIADGLLNAAHQQNHVFESIRQLQIQQSETGGLRGQDIDLLRTVEERQRAVRDATGPDSRSVTSEVAAVLREYQINQLAEEQTTARLSSLIDELRLLHGDPLAAVEEVLAEAVRRIPVTQTSALGPPPVPQLAQVEFDLRASAKTLSDLAASVDEWRRRNNLTGDLDRLIADFEAVRRDTISLGQRTIAFAVSSLTPQDRAELAKLSERQRQLSGDVLKLTGDFRAAGANQPYFSEAANRFEERRLASGLEEGALQLQRNNIGQAVTIQSQIAATLAEVSQTVKGTAVRSVESLLKQVSEAESHVEVLRGRESSLERRWKEIDGLSAANGRREMLEMLVKQHEELSLDASELARQLRLSGLAAPPTLLDQAAGRIRQTSEMLPQGRSPRIEQGYRDSADLLSRAGDELDRVRKGLEWEAAAEELWSVGSLAGSLADRQQTLEKEVRRLEGLREANQRLSRAELRTLQQTAAAQRALSADVQALILKVDEESLLRETISTIAAEMEWIAGELSQRNTSPQVADNQHGVEQRLRELSAVIETALAGSTAPDTGPTQPPENNDGRSPQSLGTVAELTLLLNEQRRLQSDTEAVLKLPPDDPDRPAQVTRLSERQKRLTTWFARLLPNAAAPGPE